MTLYTYVCPLCGEFEEFRDNNDRTYCDCGLEVKKTFGGNFKLYGAGFYTNDSAVEDIVKHKA